MVISFFFFFLNVRHIKSKNNGLESAFDRPSRLSLATVNLRV